MDPASMFMFTSGAIADAAEERLSVAHLDRHARLEPRYTVQPLDATARGRPSRHAAVERRTICIHR